MEKKRLDKLKSLLSGLKGRAIFGCSLERLSTIRIGGEGNVYSPMDEMDLAKALELFGAEGFGTKVIGKGSNILFPDEGVDEVIVSLDGENFRGMEFEGNKVTIGAGSGLKDVLAGCMCRGLSGLEGLVGIPGSFGGALATNAGHRTETCECLEKVAVLDKNGNKVWIEREDIEFRYRWSSLKDKGIILKAVFRLIESAPFDVKSGMKKMFRYKMETQPLEEKTLGCIFKNPGKDFSPSGEMIEKAGFKGKRYGLAEISPKHANFIVNVGGARAKDVIALIDTVRAGVREKYSVELETEIEIILGAK